MAQSVLLRQSSICLARVASPSRSFIPTTVIKPSNRGCSSFTDRVTERSAADFRILGGLTGRKSSILGPRLRSVAARAMTTAAKPFEPESFPSIHVETENKAAAGAGLYLIAITQDDMTTQGDEKSLKSENIKALDNELGGILSSCLAAGGFDGKKGTTSKVVYAGGSPPAALQGAKAVALVGLGKASELAGSSPAWGAPAFQLVGAGVAAAAKAQGAAKVAVSLSADLPGDKAELVRQFATGVMLGGYETLRFKSKASPTASKLSEVVLISPSPVDAQAALAKALAIAKGTMVTRFLVEAPPNVCNPTYLASAAAHIAAQAPETMKLEVLEKEQCEAMNMGLYLGVAEASATPPKFIHITYKPKTGFNGKSVALIGKGLTFDSGGYNIKAGPGSLIEMMKFDMGGAGATLGAARIISALQPAGPEIHFIVAACENMVAGAGLRPGDVLTSASGKTVEVNNTDAEGRLTLGDALWYAQEKCGVSAIVDSATLTGACLVGLGGDIGGYYANHESIAAELAAAAASAGEKMWRMPLEQSYMDQLKSPIADMKNTGSRFGGSITAALFLKEFVKEEVEWAHLDMAGPVWDDKAGLPTGFAAATLAEWAMKHGA